MIKKVGIVGFGQMGAGIAQVAAQAGYQVTANEISEELVQKGIKGITKQLDKAIEKGKLDAAGKEKVLGNIKGTTDYSDLADCDIVIEAATENMQIKKEIFAELDKICKPEAILATNTSSLPVGDLAAVTKRRDKFLGLHFFNPVPVMKLVEVIRPMQTSDEVYEKAFEFVGTLDKKGVRTADTPGFIVNRLLVPYLNDAARVFEQGLASAEDIDNAMKLGAGHPMGPLALIDLIGLDVAMWVGDILFAEFRETRFAPPPILRKMVRAGYLGKKVGKGFYDYGSGESK